MVRRSQGIVVRHTGVYRSVFSAYCTSSLVTLCNTLRSLGIPLTLVTSKNSSFIFSSPNLGLECQKYLFSHLGSNDDMLI